MEVGGVMLALEALEIESKAKMSLSDMERQDSLIQ